MSFVEAVRYVLTHYSLLKGRARRSEYWNFVLFCLLLSVMCAVLDVVFGTYVVISGSVKIPLISTLASLSVAVPSICTLVRRLHDIGKPGTWYFISFVPLVGTIILLVWLCRDSEPNENRYGPSPKRVTKKGKKSDEKGATPAKPASVSDKGKPAIARADSVADKKKPAIAETAAVSDKTGPAPEGPDSVPEKREEPKSQPAEGPKRVFAVIALGGPLQGKIYSLEDETVVFGRDASCGVRFPQATPGVSARHCQIAVEGGVPTVLDLGSSYGTFLGETNQLEAGVPARLAEGDEFWLGAFQNRFKVIVYNA